MYGRTYTHKHTRQHNIVTGRPEAKQQINKTDTHTHTHVLFSRNVWEGGVARVYDPQMTWDKGASHRRLSTVMSLIIYISFRTAHFPKRYPSRNLWCVTERTVFFFSKANLGKARGTDDALMCFPLSLFKVKATGEQIFRKMLKWGGFRNPNKCVQHIAAFV